MAYTPQCHCRRDRTSRVGSRGPDAGAWGGGPGTSQLHGSLAEPVAVRARAAPVRWPAGAPPPCPTRWACRCQIFADIVEVVRRQMIRYANRMTTEACDRLPARASGAELCPGAAELATHAVKYGALADPSGHGLSRWHIHKVAWQ